MRRQLVWLIPVLLFCYRVPSFVKAGTDALDAELGIDDTVEDESGLGIPTGPSGQAAEPSLPDRGPYTIELVTWDDPDVPVDSVCVNRAFERALTAVHWTLDIRLGKLLVTPPDARLDEDRGQVLSLKSRRKTDFTDGIHRFTPGTASFEVDGIDIVSRSPAVLVEDDTIRLRLVPVTFESRDAARTRWFPFRMKLRAGDVDLMKRFEHVGPPLARYPTYRLTMYLPAGQDYDCSWGRFRVTEEGEVKAVRLARPVQLAGRTLLLKRKAAEPDPPLQWFVAWCGEILTAGPLLWQPGRKVTLFFGARSDGDTPTGRLEPHDRSADPIPLRFAPSNAWQKSDKITTGKFFREHFLEKGTPLSAFETRVETSWRGPARLTVHFAGGQFRRDVAIIDPSAPIHLFVRRHRTAFLDSEDIECRVVVTAGKPGTVELVLQETGRPEVRLGSFPVPAAPTQTMLASIDAGKLKPGDYRLVARLGQAESYPHSLAIRSSARRSNMLISNITICTADWMESPEWAAPARQAAIGFEMLTRAGHYGYSYPTLGRHDRALTPALEASGLPVDYGLIPASGGDFLDECVRHRMGYIDYISVYCSWYNEGLSFHHTYPPDVARWVRREQVMFGSGADFPSLWGVNYTWFPRLFGYVEAGVDTDIHKHDRNRILGEKLNRAGFTRLSRDEVKFAQENCFADDAETRKKARDLVRRQVGRVRGYGEAFYEHFKLYAERIKEVRPDGMAFAFENAGHDGAVGGNYLPLFHGALDAATMEAYTDFGDWALEPAFTADWVRAAMKSCPDRQRPFWLAAEWSAPPAIRYGYMLQAVARRVEGTSYPFPSKWPETMDRTVGRIVSFLKGYGGVQPFLEVEPEVAILCSFDQMAFNGRAIYDYHACYYELIRAQYPPQLVYEETVARGGLRNSGVKIVFIVKQTVPLPPEVMDEVQAFQRRGGLVVLDSETKLPLQGARRLSYNSKNIWQKEMGGFGGEHRLALWQQYLAHRDELRRLLKGRVRPFAQSDDERMITSTLVGGDVRMVFVINDSFDPDRPEQQLNVFFRKKDVPLRLRAPDAAVYDLLTMQRADGERSEEGLLLKLDLFDHPGRILAALPEPIAAITTDAPAELALGDHFFARSRLLGKSGRPINGPTPTRLVLHAPDGKARETLYRAAGVEDPAYFRIGANDERGEWTLEVTDLVGGRQLTAPIQVRPATRTQPIARSLGRVIIPREQATVKFLNSPEQKLILLEETQHELRPLADQLAAAIREAGGAVRVVELDPTRFAEIPMRWYPSTGDKKHYQEIEKGELVGVRRGLKAYIDPKTRQHIPALGGYRPVTPKYIVRHPNIVFAGGRLASSLREILPYVATRDDPGPGNAVLALAFSAFEARMHTLAILASDPGGHEAGIEAVIGLLREFVVPPSGGPFDAGNGPPEGGTTSTRAPEGDSPLPFRLPPTSPHYTGAPSRITPHASRIIAGQTWRKPSSRAAAFRHPIADEFKGFFASVVAVNRDGDVLIQPGAGQRRVLISRDGKVLGAIEEPKGTFRVGITDDAQSIFFAARGDSRIEWMKPLADRPLVARCAIDGRLHALSVLWPEPGNDYAEGFTHKYSDYFVVGRARQGLFVTREGGLTVGPVGGRHRLYSHAPHFRDFRETHSPDWPMGMALSKDGKTLALCTWAHPTANSMGGPLFMMAMSPEVVAIDTETLETIWKVAPPEEGTWEHAAQRGCVRVNSDGSRVGYVGGRYKLFVVGRDGNIVWERQLLPPPEGHNENLYPDAFEMSDDGRAALLLYTELGLAILAREDAEPLILRPAPVTLAMAPGGRSVLGYRGGSLQGFSPAGKRGWEKGHPAGRAAVASVGERGFVLASEGGAVELWDWRGRPVWSLSGEQVSSTPVAQIHAAEDLPATKHLPPWSVDTLDILKRYCGAKLVAQADGARTLKLPSSSKILNVHLAYRKPEGNPPITVRLTDGKRRETFILDLPAPLPRVQNIAWPGRNRPLLAEVKCPPEAEIRDFQIWEFQWPSPNLAYVKPAGAADLAGDIEMGEDELEDEDLDADELETDEERAGQGLYGKMKDAFIRVRNPDPDQVQGTFLSAGDDPLKTLDGKLYSANRTKPWCSKLMTRGLWFELHFGKEAELDLLAFYSHTNKQSELIRNIGFMAYVGGNGDPPPLHKDRALALAVHNDQFFRVLAAPDSRCTELRCYLGQIRKDYGASEIEMYRAK